MTGHALVCTDMHCSLLPFIAISYNVKIRTFNGLRVACLCRDKIYYVQGFDIKVPIILLRRCVGSCVISFPPVLMLAVSVSTLRQEAASA